MKLIAITFDFHRDAYLTAFPEMLSRGIVGTYFIDHRSIDNTRTDPQDPLSPYNIGLTRDMLTQMKIAGWTIGTYLGDNMVDKLNFNRNHAVEFIKEARDTFAAKGFVAATAAPNQRAWDKRLRNLCVNLFERVRVCDQNTAQPLPFDDPLCIRKGGVPSLDNGDTPATINAQIDAFIADPAAELLVFTIHKIAPPPADHAVDMSTVLALLNRVQIDTRLRAIGFDDRELKG